MGLNDEYKESLYNDIVGFLHSVFVIDEISFENIKPLEPLTFERVFNKRYELEKRISLIPHKTVFIQNELVIMRDSKSDLETFAKRPFELLSNPLYDAVRGYIYFLEEQLPKNEPAESKEKTGIDYDSLREDLKDFLEFNKDDFKRFLEGNSPTYKGRWKGTAANAWVFIDYTNIGYKQFNDYVIHIGKKSDAPRKITSGDMPKLRGERRTPYLHYQKQIISILKKHIQPPDNKEYYKK